MLTTLLLLAAHPAPPAPPAPPSAEPKVVREVVIHRDHEAGARAGAGEKREVHIIRRKGDSSARVATLGNCEGGRKFETEAESGKEGETNRTRIILCTTDGKDGATHADTLERAAKRIAEDKQMPEEVRARVLASLTAEIARLKSAR